MAELSRRLSAWSQQRRSRSNSRNALEDANGPGSMEIDPDWEMSALAAKQSAPNVPLRGRGIFTRRGTDENSCDAVALTRSRSKSFYEDDAEVEADLGAAVAAGWRGDRGHAPDAAAQPRRERSPPLSTSAAGAGAAVAGDVAVSSIPYSAQRTNALKPNELRALSQGLLDASALHRKRAESSDFDDDFSSGSESSDEDSSGLCCVSAGTAIAAAHFDGTTSSSSSSSARTPLPYGADGLPRRPSGSIPGASLPPRVPSLRLAPTAAAAVAAGSDASSSSIQQQQQQQGGASSYGSHLRRQSPAACKKIKILMLGDSAVGKSSLMNRFTEDTFQPGLVGTVGVDFKMKTVDVGGEPVVVQVWDTAGQCRFHRITHTYYRGSHGILLVYDMSEPSTLENIAYWMHNIQTHAASGVHTCLVGNKRDLCTSSSSCSSSRSTSPHHGTAAAAAAAAATSTANNSSSPQHFELSGTETGRTIADKYGVAFFETSAKTGHNVKDAFMSLVNSVQTAMAAEAQAAQTRKPPTPGASAGRRARRKDRPGSSSSSTHQQHCASSTASTASASPSPPGSGSVSPASTGGDVCPAPDSAMEGVLALMRKRSGMLSRTGSGSAAAASSSYSGSSSSSSSILAAGGGQGVCEDTCKKPASCKIS